MEYLNNTRQPMSLHYWSPTQFAAKTNPEDFVAEPVFNPVSVRDTAAKYWQESLGEVTIMDQAGKDAVDAVSEADRVTNLVTEDHKYLKQVMVDELNVLRAGMTPPLDPLTIPEINAKIRAKV